MEAKKKIIEKLPATFPLSFHSLFFQSAHFVADSFNPLTLSFTFNFDDAKKKHFTAFEIGIRNSCHVSTLENLFFSIDSRVKCLSVNFSWQLNIIEMAQITAL
jgi:hypothetical protein